MRNISLAQRLYFSYQYKQLQVDYDVGHHNHLGVSWNVASGGCFDNLQKKICEISLPLGCVHTQKV